MAEDNDEEGNQISKRGLNTPITTDIKNIKSLKLSLTLSSDNI